jgi:hypothetical protein
MKNNIATKGYFVKRLKDSGYETWMIFDKYSETDPRKFTLLIDPTGAAVYCTCYENLSEIGDILFELHDGGQYIPFRLRIQTDSFEIIVKHLTQYGIVRKYEPKPKEEDE